MIVFHHNDHDGRCAAAIVNYRFKSPADIRFVELDYKMPVPLELIKKDEEIYIVDFSFKPEIMAEVMKITRNIVWCDHHVTCEGYENLAMQGLRSFTDKGLSGCELTWNFLSSWMGLPMPACVELIGDYDSWRLNNPLSLAFYEGLKLQDTTPDSELWPNLFMGVGIEEITRDGETVIKYRDNYCNKMMKSHGYETKIDGQRTYATNLYGFGSQGFGKKFDEYPICIAYIYDGKVFTVSMYSKSIDVSVIAKKYGGGGHRGAAGFVCEELPFE